MNASGSGIVRAFRRTAVPLASYYAVTLGVPLANGAAESGALFLHHALLVLLVPPLVVAVASAVSALAAAVDRACGRMSPHGAPRRLLNRDTRALRSGGLP